MERWEEHQYDKFTKSVDNIEFLFGIAIEFERLRPDMISTIDGYLEDAIEQERICLEFLDGS